MYFTDKNLLPSRENHSILIFFISEKFLIFPPVLVTYAFLQKYKREREREREKKRERKKERKKERKREEERKKEREAIAHHEAITREAEEEEEEEEEENGGATETKAGCWA